MPPSAQKPRRARPSRARGLRTSTGCLVCRKRRIKCDEGAPRCGQCSKSDRNCVYGKSATNAQQTEPRHESQVDVSEGGNGMGPGSGSDDSSNLLSLLGPPADGPINEAPPDDQLGPVDPELQGNGVSVSEVVDTIEASAGEGNVSASGLAFSPVEVTHEPFLNTSALEWFDLLAQDAITNIQRHNNVARASSRFNFDETSLSRRPSPEPEARNTNGHVVAGINGELQDNSLLYTHSWNTKEPIPILGDDLFYFRHYIDVVSPILDLFDAGKHFTNLVPHLATRNTGLLKSILAVAARHASLRAAPRNEDDSVTEMEHCSPESQPGNESFDRKSGRLATQYYYETLQYLSQTLSFQSYADSLEILATAILISAYEMFGSSGPFHNSEWERHLRGAFWIQRCQDNDGESIDGLRRAVWWGWLRQDLFAAFLAGRPVMTIWYPKKSLEELNTDEYATRILYISAKIVDFANVKAEAIAKDFQRRITQANKLWSALQSWDALLPVTFRPIPLSSGSADQDTAIESHSSLHSEPSPSVRSQGTAANTVTFEPIWIHPPSHAGAVQTYHFARIVLLLHMPTLGGVDEYKLRQRQLDESVRIICGIAINDMQDPSLAFVHVQALYAAGLCVQSPEKRATVIQLLRKALEVSVFPTKDLIGSLRAHWGESN